MTPAQIIAIINAQIVSNGIGGITGPVLNSILVAICNLFTSAPSASRIVSASTAFTTLATDVRIGFLRTLSLAPTAVQLYAYPTGSEIILQDLAGNFSTYPVTLSAPAGQTFSGGRTTYVMNEDNQTARFYFYGSNILGVEPA